MTIGDLVEEGLSKGLDRLEVDLLIAKVLKKERTYIHIYPEEEVGLLSEDIRTLFKKRVLNYPFHYLTGVKEWMGLEFKVDRGVLIPREDTRILFEGILKYSVFFKKELRILELGVGSGILSTLVSLSIPRGKVTGIEISSEAFEVALENIDINGGEVELLQGDLFLPIGDRKFEIVFSNPPYISEKEYEDLPLDVRKEPEIALYGGVDGLDFYRRIAESGKKNLVKDGFILLEIGYDQFESVREIFENKGYVFKEKLLDDGNRDRVVVFKNEN